MASVPQTFGIGSVQALTDAATITWDLSQPGGNIPPATSGGSPGAGNSGKVTLGGNRTLNILNMADGQVVRLFVTQDGTGSRTLAITTGGAASKVAGTLSTTAGATDQLEIVQRNDLGYALVTVLGKAYA